MVTFNTSDIRKFDPFFVGADRLWRHIDDLHRMAETPVTNYPPYNICKIDDEHYTVEMAVAGFTEKDLDLTLEDGKLTVVGNIEQETDDRKILHKGIANRSFKREFTLADTIEIAGANLEHGMLTITLKNVVPDHKKPKKIEVTTGDKLLEVKSEPELLTEE